MPALLSFLSLIKGTRRIGEPERATAGALLEARARYLRRGMLGSDCRAVLPYGDVFLCRSEVEAFAILAFRDAHPWKEANDR